MPDIIIDTVTIARNASAAESFETEEELLAEFREDGYFAFAEDTQRLFFRCSAGWRDVGGRGTIIYDTEAALLADSPTDGNIGFAADVDSFYSREASTWVPFAVSGGENNSGANVGAGASIFKDKTGVTLRFRTVVAASNKLLVTEGIDTVSVDAVPGNISHQSLSGAGTNTHSEIDTALDVVADHINDATIHRSINDAGSSITDLLSAAQIQSLMSHKRDSSEPIDHETELSNVGVITHSEIDTALAESAAHIADMAVHHTIDDSTTDTGTLWSSEKTHDELELKRDIATAIDHDDLLNIGTNSHVAIDSHIANATIHRQINDSGTTTSDLYSASKINTLVNAKATDAAVVHNSGDETISGNKSFTQTIAGNAATATLAATASAAIKLQTARNINGVSFDGTSNVTVPIQATTVTAGASGTAGTVSIFTSGTHKTSVTASALTQTADLLFKLPNNIVNNGILSTSNTGVLSWKPLPPGFYVNVDTSTNNPGALPVVNSVPVPNYELVNNGSETVSLPDASIAVGYTFTIAYAAPGSSNQVTIQALAGQPIYLYGAGDVTVTSDPSATGSGAITLAAIDDQKGNYYWAVTAVVGQWLQLGLGGGGSVDAGDLTGATLAAGVTASSLTSVSVLNGLSVNSAVNFNDVGSAVIHTYNVGASESAGDLIFKRGGDLGTGGFEVLYDTRSGYPWTGGGSGAGFAFLAYGGNRMTVAMSAYDYSKYGWIVDADAQQMSTGCQMQLLNLASDPTPMGPGATYFNTTLGKQRIYNGSAWETVTSI